MSQEELIRRAWAALEAARRRPPEQEIQRLIDEGIIDANGDAIFVHGKTNEEAEAEEKKGTEEPKG